MFQTTNQVSLDWLKEPPKKYIPFLDFPEIRKSSARHRLSKSSASRSANPWAIRFQTRAASELSQNSAKNANIQYVLINTIQLYL